MTDTLIHAKSIVAKLTRAGYTAYFAGGWVRDYVMGHPSEDIDIATNASPVEIMDLFPYTILVGLAFGVVIVVIEGHQFEVATFRKDLPYINGRHPEGIEMSTPHEDAMRRDFTINGMFYDPLEECIHDFVHGQEDIKRRVIRTIGDPHERFFEDRLRMLRAFRFSARFSFSIEPETQQAIQENANKMFPAVALERVWQEFNKMANYPCFDHALVEMHRLTLLDVIFPEIAGMHIKEMREKVAHFSHFPRNCPTILYLMELFTSFPLPQKIEVAKRLKAPNKEIKLMEFMDQIEQAIDQELKDMNDDDYLWALLLANDHWKICVQVVASRLQGEAHAHFFQRYADRYGKLEPHIQRLREGKPLVSAALLQKNGVHPGKEMGILLKEAEKIAITQDLHDPHLILATLSSTALWKKRRNP